MNRTHFFKRPSNTMIRMFHVRAHFSLLTCIEATVGGERGRWRGKGGGGGGGGGGYSTNVYTGRLRPEIKLLTLS